MHIPSQRKSRPTAPLCESCERVEYQTVVSLTGDAFLVCHGCAALAGVTRPTPAR